MGLSTPTTGWLAANLMKFGSSIALSVLAIAITLEDGLAGDEQINAFYADLAATDDSVWVVNQHYLALEAAHPWLSGHLGVLTGWTEDPSIEHYSQARAIAEVLADIAWSEAEPLAGGEILGRVYNHMISIGARRLKIFNYTPIENALVEAMMECEFRVLSSIVDAWCGSGTRVMGMWRYQQIVGGPQDIPVRLNDPNPYAIAMAGLNMVGAQIGPDVKLSCSRDWAEKWGTSSFYGRAPSIRKMLPPELSIDVELAPLESIHPLQEPR